MLLGWWQYICAVVNGAAACHPLWDHSALNTSHLCRRVVARIFIILYIDIYAVWNTWERPPNGEADGVTIPPILAWQYRLHSYIIVGNFIYLFGLYWSPYLVDTLRMARHDASWQRGFNLSYRHDSVGSTCHTVMMAWVQTVKTVLMHHDGLYNRGLISAWKKCTNFSCALWIYITVLASV